MFTCVPFDKDDAEDIIVSTTKEYLRNAALESGIT
jgi:hypothetical protein